MAREPEKSGRESAKPKTEDEAGSTGSPSGSKGGAASRGAAKSAGQEAASQEGASKQSVAEFQGARHRELQDALAKRSEENADAPAIVEEFAAVWLPYHLVESEILAPALEDSGADQGKTAAVKIRKDIVNLLLADLLETGAAEFAEPRLDALSDALDALVGASNAGLESLSGESERMSALGSQMSARYERIKRRFSNLDESIGEAMDMLAPRSLSVSSRRQRIRGRENVMARYSNMRERDEQGRFMPDDDREYSRGGGYRGGQERDEAGRFMSEGGRRPRSRYEDEYEGGRRSMSRGRDYDEDERYSRRGEGRGRGGWFGDPEGHSEASRRGWERSDHGESGWFGDPEGHSEASRRGWRSGQHGESGWYGDPEGHSEAARRGWEHGHEGNYRSRSSRYDDEDDRRGAYESRRSSRYEDENDDRGYRGRSRSGHGGWSGDPEGHSEAARRGWERRG